MIADNACNYYSSNDSIKIASSLYFVGIYTAKATYICVTCVLYIIKTIGTTVTIALKH